MKPVYLIRGAFAAALLSACVGSAAHAQGKIEIVGGSTHDWGTVAPSNLTTVVELKNVGQGDLKITEVRPGCGCTLASKIDKDVLKPGETGKFNIGLNVSSYQPGPVSKIVTIRSSDPTDSVMILHLAATIKRAYTVAPSNYFLVSNGQTGVETATSAVTIKNTGDQPFTVFPPEFGQGNVKVRFDMKDKKELKPGESVDVKAYVTPLEKESVYGSVKIKTSSKEQEMIDMNITGTMAPTSAPQTNTQTAPVDEHAGHSHK
jgi:hypothetical protein